MLPDAGVMGFGPGSFRAIFAEYQREHDFGDRQYPDCWKTGLWQEAHQDYLQTVIEWGFFGALGWAILVGGGVVRGAVQYFRLRAGLSTRWLLLCSLLAVSATLVHSFIDFPLQIASIQLYVCVLLAVCWSSREVPASVAA
jgi:O-antigen ligase